MKGGETGQHKYVEFPFWLQRQFHPYSLLGERSDIYDNLECQSQSQIHIATDN
jgi:hypothetical protein